MDVERDCFIINGSEISGSIHGLDTVLSIISDTFDEVLKDKGLPSIPNEIKEEFCLLALVKVSLLCITSSVADSNSIVSLSSNFI